MRALAILMALAPLIIPVAARADDNASSIPAKARALAGRGRAYHDAGNYANAIAAFSQAYVMAPSPALLFNLAQAYRLQGNCDDAVLMYRRYLATGPGDEQRALAETQLANVERCAGKLVLHGLATTTPGRPATPPSGVVASTTAAMPRKAKLAKGVGIGLAIGGSAALGVAAYYAVRAHDAANDVSSAYVPGAKWRDIAPIDERGKEAATTARLFGAGGAIAIASGVALYMIGKHIEHPSVAVVPTRHGGEVSVQWAF